VLIDFHVYAASSVFLRGGCWGRLEWRSVTPFFFPLLGLGRLPHYRLRIIHTPVGRYRKPQNDVLEAVHSGYIFSLS
jgi:hypothetical protein